MNRQFDLLLRLVDIRVAYLNNIPEQSRIVPLERLTGLLEQVVIATETKSKIDNMAIIWNDVWLSLNQFQDYQGAPIYINPMGPQDGFITVSPVATTPSPQPLSTVLKVNQAYTSTYKPPNAPADSPPLHVRGIITATDQQVMRTDGIVVDAFVGAGNALDPYNTALQTQELAEKQAENDRRRLANSVVQNNNAEQAAAYRQVFYGPPASLSMRLATDSKTGAALQPVLNDIGTSDGTTASDEA